MCVCMLIENVGARVAVKFARELGQAPGAPGTALPPQRGPLCQPPIASGEGLVVQ